jgi:multimeric flavodoxin WrbA
MKITILNGSPDSKDESLDIYLASLGSTLTEMGHSVNELVLRDMDLRYCTGCFDCWVKTPGECKVQDDSRVVCREAINSDLMIFASPIIMGFTSVPLKKAMDKLIPLIHPYTIFVQGEVHHHKRYKNYPKVGLIMQTSPSCDAEDLEITRTAFHRVALNFRSKLYFSALSDQPVEEVCNEIDHL